MIMLLTHLLQLKYSQYRVMLPGEVWRKNILTSLSTGKPIFVAK